MPKPNVREQLIKAGLRTMHSYGFNGCAVQDITDAAEVPKGSFYNHFSSKEALACAALERFWENGIDRRSVLQDTSIDPVERLRRYFQMMTEALVRNKFKNGCFIGNLSTEMSHNKEFRDQLEKIFNFWTDSIEACVHEAEQSGRTKLSAPSKAIAAFLVNSWEGAVLRSKVEHNASALEQFNLVVFKSLFS